MWLRLRWRLCVWACVVIASAVGVGRVVQVLSVDDGSQEDSNITLPSSRSLKSYSNVTLGTQSSDLIWFIQISDVHLSIWHDAERIEQFKQFCKETVHQIAPAVVLATGDLTDAKSVDGMGSQQYIKEWEHYHSILKESGLYNTTVWLDVRGNHDNFNLPSLSSEYNLFKTHSVQGPRHRRSYLHSFTDGKISIAFVAVDATPLPGPKRPFNFVGLMPPSEYTLLKQYAHESRQHDFSVWFGHYPTSCILGPDQGVHDIRNMMSGAVAYLCGHLHSLAGLVPAMYTRQQNGLLELELEDWKDGRMFRVMAIDHGQFSFSDVRFNTWPVIVVTNPRHGLYLHPRKEPLSVMSKSTHIRALIWSSSPLSKVVVHINSGNAIEMLPIDEGPLYVASWDPSKYMSGVHYIKVVAIDSEGRKNLIEQPFTIEGTRLHYRFWPRVFLMSNISSVFQLFFGCSISVCVLPLCFIKYAHFLLAKTDRKNICRGGAFRWLVLRKVVRMFWLFCAADELFWPVVIYILYIPFGPWLVGELLDNQYGVIFSWGMIVNSSYLPGSLTYAYGFALMTFYIIPLVCGISYSVDCKVTRLFIHNARGSLLHQGLRHVPVLIPIALQSYLTYFMFLAYGWLSVLVGPIRSWSVLLGFYLWIQAERLSHQRMKRAAELWYGDLSSYSRNRVGVSYLADEAEPPCSGDLRRWLHNHSSCCSGNDSEERTDTGLSKHSLNDEQMSYDTSNDAKDNFKNQSSINESLLKKKPTVNDTDDISDLDCEDAKL